MRVPPQVFAVPLLALAVACSEEKPLATSPLLHDLALVFPDVSAAQAASDPGQRRAGIAATIANPTDTVWWPTAILAYVTQAQVNADGLAIGSGAFDFKGSDAALDMSMTLDASGRPLSSSPPQTKTFGPYDLSTTASGTGVTSH